MAANKMVAAMGRSYINRLRQLIQLVGWDEIPAYDF